MIKKLLLIGCMLCAAPKVFAQTPADSTSQAPSEKVKIIQTDGTIRICKIISQNQTEVTVQLEDGRTIVIPQFAIKEIVPLSKSELSKSGKHLGDDMFSSRYFLTTNGFGLEKSYVQWNLFGPDFQFRISNKFGVGIMTSWFGIPVIGTLKYADTLTENVSYGVGALLGTGSWFVPDFGLALPFAALTLGNRKTNINFSGGYGAVWSDGNSTGRFLCSVAGTAKISKNLSFVFDSFIMPEVVTTRKNIFTGNNEIVTLSALAVITPGLRIQNSQNSAFQFGFTGLYAADDWAPVPIPTVQWFRSL